jgi:ATP adenylyltransferase
MEYIRAAKEGDQEDEGCIFCTLPAKGDDESALILKRGEHGFVVLNRFPYNPGALMVAPFEHTGPDFEKLSAEVADELQTLIRESVAALREQMQPHGFNIGMNVGRIAGAGFPDHLHWHVVPRWGGDTNFMPVIGQTRILPELLAETYAHLAPLFA